MRNKITILILFLIALVFYSLTLRGVPGNITGSSIKNNLDQATKPFELSPERDRFILTLSLAENKSFSLPKDLAIAAQPDDGYYKGRYYIFFPPGISLLVTPLYLLGKHFNLSQVGAFFTIVLFAVLNLIFLFKIARDIFKLPLWSSVMTSLIFGFGSTAWSYAITLYQHHVSTFFIISGFYAVWKFKKNERFGWLWALYVWFLYGFGVFIDYPNALLMMPVMVYFFLSSVNIVKFNIKEKTNIKVSLRMSFVLTASMFVLLVLIHGYYNYVNFGSVKRVSGSLPNAKYVLDQNLNKTASGEAALAAMSAKKDNVISFFTEDYIPRGLEIQTIGVDRGIFLFSPIFLLALLGILYSLKKINMETGILIATLAVNVLLYVSWGDPWGGWAFGPRYMIPSMAILSLFIGMWLSAVGQKIIAKTVTFILFIYSCAIALLGALTTNQVPPKVEADYLHTGYNFLQNLKYFLDNRSSSFMFNQYFSEFMDLKHFAALIYGILILIAFFTLFILPRFEKK